MGCCDGAAGRASLGHVLPSRVWRDALVGCFRSERQPRRLRFWPSQLCVGSRDPGAVAGAGDRGAAAGGDRGTAIHGVTVLSAGCPRGVLSFEFPNPRSPVSCLLSPCLLVSCLPSLVVGGQWSVV